MIGRWLALGIAGVALAGQAHASCDDGSPNADCDLDGYTVGDGDCDDWDPDAYPGGEEYCGTGVDEDCDGQVDEAGEQRTTDDSLSGGGACSTTGGPGALLALPLIGLLTRRRRSV